MESRADLLRKLAESKTLILLGGKCTEDLAVVGNTRTTVIPSKMAQWLNVPCPFRVTSTDIIVDRNGGSSYLKIPKAKELQFFSEYPDRFAVLAEDGSGKQLLIYRVE